MEEHQQSVDQQHHRELDFNFDDRIDGFEDSNFAFNDSMTGHSDGLPPLPELPDPTAAVPLPLPPVARSATSGSNSPALELSEKARGKQRQVSERSEAAAPTVIKRSESAEVESRSSMPPPASTESRAGSRAPRISTTPSDPQRDASRSSNLTSAAATGSSSKKASTQAALSESGPAGAVSGKKRKAEEELRRERVSWRLSALLECLTDTCDDDRPAPHPSHSVRWSLRRSTQLGRPQCLPLAHVSVIPQMRIHVNGRKMKRCALYPSIAWRRAKTVCTGSSSGLDLPPSRRTRSSRGH